MAGIRGLEKWKWVAIFLAPSLIGMLLFIVYPIVSSFWLSFQDWNLLSPPEFTGLGNYQELLSDAGFWRAVQTTLQFIVFYIPAVFIGGLALALFLNNKVRGMVLVRTTTFLPVVASWVVVSLIWKWIFNPSYGLVNPALAWVGIEGPSWLFEPQPALFAMVFTSVWKDVGYIALLFLGGLQNISETYYEAARIDGANRWRSLRHITLPLLTSTMFFVTITMLINCEVESPVSEVRPRMSPRGSSRTNSIAKRMIE